jgi:hypothetical protein
MSSIFTASLNLSLVFLELAIQDIAFLDHALADAGRTAHQAAKLRIPDEKVTQALSRNADRLDRFRDVLENLKETDAVTTRSAAFPPPKPLQINQKGNGR